MGMLDNVSKQQASGAGGDYLGAGDHIAVIEKVKLIETPTNGEAAVCEVVIIESTNGESHGAGTMKSIMWLDKHMAAKADFKKFIMDISECSEVEASDVETLGEIVGGDQPFAGIPVKIHSFTKMTKQQVSLVKHQWTLCSDPKIVKKAEALLGERSKA